MRAPDWRRMYAASAPLNRVLRGTNKAPAPTAPRAAITHSAQLGAQMATRSPRSIPLATMAPVTEATASASWSKVSRTVVPAGPVDVDDGLGLAEAGGGVLHQAGDGPPLQIPSRIGHI